MSTKSNVCKKCGKPIEQLATGRPRKFCSAACSKASEKEIARLQKHIYALENDRFHYENDHTDIYYMSGYKAPALMVITVAEISRLEGRMRELLDDAE